MAWSSPRTWTTGEVVTAAHMNQEVRDNITAGFPDAVSAPSWTPILEASTTNPAPASVTGREWAMGALQFVWVRYVFAVGGPGGNAGSGTYFVTLPTAASGITASGTAGQAIGSWQARDVTATTSHSGSVHLRSATTAAFSRADATVGATAITDSAPFDWDTNDVLSFFACYPIA